MVLSCRRELNFTISTKKIKRPLDQSPPPLGADFWVILGVHFGTILGPKIYPKSTTVFHLLFDDFLDNFFMFFWHLLITWKLKKQCEVDREAMLCNSEKHWKTLYSTIKMKSRKRRGCLKNKQERQLDSPKKQSERQARRNAISESMLKRCWVHFGDQNGSKIASKF